MRLAAPELAEPVRRDPTTRRDHTVSTDHRIYTGDPDDDERVYWECSCGTSGSCRADQADLASDRHIRPGETRTDVSRPS